MDDLCALIRADTPLASLAYTVPRAAGSANAERIADALEVNSNLRLWADWVSVASYLRRKRAYDMAKGLAENWMWCMPKCFYKDVVGVVVSMFWPPLERALH